MTDLPEQPHVLFVAAEPTLQRTVSRLLRAGVPEARVTCVGDGGRALGVLRREAVDLMITDRTLPDMDGGELLHQLTHLRIHLPSIAVIGDGDPADEKPPWDAVDTLFPWPIEAELFVRGVREMLEVAVHRSHIEGVSIAGFVQLLTMERASCALRASIPGAQGLLYFSAGSLIDARQAELGGVDAALEIFTWKDPIITLEAPSRDRVATIHVGVTELLLESARLSDERERNLRRTGARTASAGARGPALSLVPPPTRTSRPASAPMAVATATLGPALASAVESALAPTTGLDLELAPRPAAAPEAAAISPQLPATRAGPRLAAWEEHEAQAAIAGLLVDVMQIDGALGAAVAHWELDQTLAQIDLGGVVRRDAAAAGDCRVMRALMAVMNRLGLRPQDTLISLEDQSHILWPLTRHDGLFLSLAVDRARGNLALTRRRLQKLIEARAL